MFAVKKQIHQFLENALTDIAVEWEKIFGFQLGYFRCLATSYSYRNFFFQRSKYKFAETKKAKIFIVNYNHLWFTAKSVSERVVRMGCENIAYTVPLNEPVTNNGAFRICNWNWKYKY